MTDIVDYKPGAEVVSLTRLIEDGMPVQDAMKKILVDRENTYKPRRGRDRKDRKVRDGG